MIISASASIAFMGVNSIAVIKLISVVISKDEDSSTYQAALPTSEILSDPRERQ